MWITTPFENILEQQLLEQLGEEIGRQYYTRYCSARDTLIKDNILSDIKGVEPNLTDHSEDHIGNVLDNAHRLLGSDIETLTGIELYCLALIILFHDVGNIEGRVKHNKNIMQIYNHVRGKDPSFRQERNIVTTAAQAHCGCTINGSKDTLKSVDEVSNIDGHKVRLRYLASILRFADELAEGNQRTSSFMINNHKYDKESEVYHRYAEITDIFIDRDGERVVLTYNIDINPAQITQEDVQTLLNFTCERIVKLDEERRYTKHHCDLLIPFKKTSIKFNFFNDGIPIDIDIDKIELFDKYPIPGEGDFDKNNMNILLEKIRVIDVVKSIFNK